jgi:hypothetical protein
MTIQALRLDEDQTKSSNPSSATAHELTGHDTTPSELVPAARPSPMLRAQVLMRGSFGRFAAQTLD